jgi:hypothetical protein
VRNPLRGPRTDNLLDTKRGSTDHAGHGGWSMVWMMVACCVPMIAILVVAASATR